jgi:ABC-2 type transport system permease protein
MTNNLQFVENLLDWSVEDVELLSIRSRGTYARTLKPMADSAPRKWEMINYGIALAGLALIAGIVFARRRKLEPIRLTPANDETEE